MAVTREFVQSVRSVIAENPAVSLEKLARSLDASEAHVIMALPVSMRTRVRPTDLAALWESLSALGHVSLHCSAPVGFSAGSIQGTDPVPFVSGRLPVPPLCQDEIGFIWLVALPTIRGESYSVRFFNKNGHSLLSAHLAGNTSADPSTQGRNSFEVMRSRFGVTPKPRRQCKGCGQCSCGKNKHRPPIEQSARVENIVSTHQSY